MVQKILKFRNLFKLFVFIPLIFYFGKRSYIAFDEGFYALQARWILDKGNWTIPLWWDGYVLDRTIGLQFLKTFSINGLLTFLMLISMLFKYYLHKKFYEDDCSLNLSLNADNWN